ncbi:hypothetical protein Unana1_04641 [Umbelopsis nana]
MFLDDEPLPVETMDTSTPSSAPKQREDIRDIKSLVWIDLNAQQQNDEDEPSSTEEEYEEPPELGHSDSETLTSETDTPLTPTTDYGFEHQRGLQTNKTEFQDTQGNSNDNAEICDDKGDDNSTILIQAPSAAPVDEAISILNNPKSVLETCIADALDSDDQSPPPAITNEATLPDVCATEQLECEKQDELEDRCIVDALIEKLNENASGVTLDQPKSFSSEVTNITTQIQLVSKMSPAELVRLESMFASFIMVVILQAVANAFSFTKAILD